MSFDLKLVSGDLVINSGDLQPVIDSNKLVQDILKICLTEAGTNPLYPWYGSYISRSLVGSALETSITLQVAQTQLQNSIELLKTVQEEQMRSLQSVTPGEQIAAILDISVYRNPNDLRFYTVRIKVLNRGGAPVGTSFSINAV